MKTKESLDSSEENPLHVAIGVFPNATDLSRISASIRCPEIEFQRVSLSDPASTDDLPEIVYDPVEKIEVNDVNKGIATGGMIGFSSGLLAGLPTMGTGTGLFLAAPLAGLLAGAWIGGVAGIDEANRSEEQPNHEDYEVMLKAGKALLVISGDAKERERVQNEMMSLGAEKVYQHPPLHHVVRSPGQASDDQSS